MSPGIDALLPCGGAVLALADGGVYLLTRQGPPWRDQVAVCLDCVPDTLFQDAMRRNRAFTQQIREWSGSDHGRPRLWFFAGHDGRHVLACVMVVTRGHESAVAKFQPLEDAARPKLCQGAADMVAQVLLYARDLYPAWRGLEWLDATLDRVPPPLLLAAPGGCCPEA